mgnify:CR=1 FL=1
MKRILTSLLVVACPLLASAQGIVFSTTSVYPLTIDTVGGHLTYSVGDLVQKAPLGFSSNIGDFSQKIKLIGTEQTDVDVDYTANRQKTSHISHKATEVLLHLQADGKNFDVRFHLSAHDVAFRYEIPKQGETGSIRIYSEQSGFRFPEQTTTFLCPQSDAMIGWKRTKPSYEEEYLPDEPMQSKSKYGHGYTFPCLFHIGDKGWVLVSETDVDSRYCASHLSDYQGDGLYQIAFPMPEENNGNGTIEPAFALPGHTPWRTLTLGETLKPIVESTIATDVVEPRYETEHQYQFGKGTWSWILWQDNSINLADQKKYVDLAAAMNYQYVLVDNWWDLNITRDSIPELVKYAKSKNVDLFMWYSSSGYWNDIVQGPINYMDNSIVRKREMRWLKSIGVKGIKVDFFGGDKQETMRLYEDILSDADDNGLMVIFHGCTLPRGWERMYPNYVGSEAVLASENLIFDQHFCDVESFNATLHPFVRNAVGCMEFGGCFMNKRMSRSNADGNTRRTTDIFELATTILFQNPIQNFALAPNNLTDAPQICLDYLRTVPTTWDETRFVSGYPGRNIVMARRNGNKWYVVAVNGTDTPLAQTIDLSDFVRNGQTVSFYFDDIKQQPKQTELKIRNATKVNVKLQPRGAAIFIVEIAD